MTPELIRELADFIAFLAFTLGLAGLVAWFLRALWRGR